MPPSPRHRRASPFAPGTVPPPVARALRRALAALDAGDRATVGAALDEALDADPEGATTRALVARVRFLAGGFDGALGELEAAADRAEDPAYPRRLRLAWLIRLHYLQEAREALEPLLAGTLDANLARTAADLLARTGAPDRALACLEALGGNLTPWPTRLGPDGLQPVPAGPSPRTLAREVQHQVVWRGIDATLDALDPVLEALDHHPVAECYRGELLLWAERFPEARASFEGILDREPGTTWGWFGLAATLTRTGEAEAALEALARGRAVLGYAGASMPMYRAEALWHLGRLQEAAAELEKATTVHPTRFAAWVLRVRVEDALGRPAPRDEAFAVLAREAAPLVEVAATVAGVPRPAPGQPPGDAAEPIAGAALRLLRGSRSSACPVWFAPDTGAVRSLVLHHPVFPGDTWQREHAALARDLDRATGARRA